MVGKIFFFKRWQDFQGKRVNIGNPSFGHHGTMEVLWQRMGCLRARLVKSASLTLWRMGKPSLMAKSMPWFAHLAFRMRLFPW